MLKVLNEKFMKNWNVSWNLVCPALCSPSLAWGELSFLQKTVSKPYMHTAASYTWCSTFPGRGQGSVQKEELIVGERFGVKEIFTALLGTLVIASVSWQ